MNKRSFYAKFTIAKDEILAKEETLEVLNPSKLAREEFRGIQRIEKGASALNKKKKSALSKFLTLKPNPVLEKSAPNSVE